MEFAEIIIETKKAAQKQEPWQIPLARYVSTNKKQDVVYNGLAAPGFLAPNGVMILGGSERQRLYGRETVVASKRIYHRDMGNDSFEAWAIKLQSTKGSRFRIVMITYFLKEGQKFDPNKVIDNTEGSYAIRAGFVFEDVKKPFAGWMYDPSTLKKWGGDEFFAFVKQHGGWNPPNSDEKLKEAEKGQNITIMRAHRKAVAEAIRSGKSVPKDVLKDYPRLTEHKPGTPGFYVAQFLLTPIDFAKPGDTVQRVVYGKIGSRITPNTTGVLNIPGDPDIGGLHVTRDVNFWKKQLNRDYNRPEKSAQIIHIKVAPGDIFLADHNFTRLPESERPSSAILVTSRKILKQGEDFYIEGKLAGKV